MMISKDGFFKGCLYQLAFWGCGWDHNDVPTNICPFIRKVIWGVLAVIFTTVVSVGLIIAIIDPVVSLLLYLFGVGSGFYFSEFSTLIGLILYGFTIIIFLSYWWSECESAQSLKDTIKTPIEQASETSGTWQVIKQWFKAIHDKTCFKVEFKEEN